MSMYPIASFSGAGAGRTFSSIPQTFTHLQIRMTVRDVSLAASSFGFLRFNGDTGANYRNHSLSGNGSITGANSGYGISGYMPVGFAPAAAATANVYGSFIIDILDYTNTNKNKVVRTISGFDTNGAGTVALFSGLWTSTAAITSIQCGSDASSDDTGTRIDLYGISTSSATGA
jgi:hypothetical protein